VRLWVFVLLLSIGMTLFLNNDGSILIATPIICELTKRLGLDHRRTAPFILGSALVATASSAPIGVSNPANLEAMALAGFNLITHTEYMFLPSVLGLCACLVLLWWRFRRDIPATYSLDSLDEAFPVTPPPPPPHAHFPRLPHPALPPHLQPPHLQPPPPPPPHGPVASPHLIKDIGLMRFTVAVVVAVRVGFFAASLYHIPTSLVAVAGALVVVVASLSRRSIKMGKVLLESPWHILAFAFGMELVVFGLRNTGLIGALGQSVAPLLHQHLWAVVVLPATAVGLLSGVMNIHPALIAGTLTLISLELPFVPLKLAYTGVVLGSDILSLLTPMGTLASLLWFHLIHRQGLRFTWGEYMATSLRVIPLSFAASLVGLYLWALLVR
jgi:arsenical pump membrane protein